MSVAFRSAKGAVPPKLRVRLPAGRTTTFAERKTTLAEAILSQFLGHPYAGWAIASVCNGAPPPIEMVYISCKSVA